MDQDIIYKRTYASLRIHALRHNGYLSAYQLKTLHIPTTPEVLADVLAFLQAESLLNVTTQQGGKIIYDFLPFLEKAIEESALDLATRFQLANIYIQRKMWTHAIAELRFIRTNPKYKKESLYLLARCFEEKGAFEKARENYERLIATDYYYNDALDRLTRLIQRQNQATVIIPTDTVATAQQQLSHVVQDRYEVVRELGRGGAGIVYQAIDLKFKRDVALKVLYNRSAQSEQNVSSFLQEARLVAQLNHPNIVDVYDVNVDAQLIAMEYVDGGTLRDLLKARRQLPLSQARTMLIQLCRGLQAAHHAGILHRDLKPRNIFITRQKKVKLGDFGIAHIATSDQDDFTQISSQIGTLPYMSPEQLRGEQVSPASDLYAVGVMFYELLTGAPPFIQGDVAYHHLYTPPPPPGISEEIDAVILRCLEKHPAQRFQSAEELCQLLVKQEHAEKERLNKYRQLLQIAMLDKELSKHELLVLKLKRKEFHISEQEAKQVEQELGLTLPA